MCQGRGVLLYVISLFGFKCPSVHLLKKFFLLFCSREHLVCLSLSSLSICTFKTLASSYKTLSLGLCSGCLH